MDSIRYQHIVVHGTAYQRGLSHGKQVSAKIRTNITQYAALPSLPPLEVCKQYISDYYLPAVQQHFQAGLEEMKGIADGAEVSLQDVLLLNARYDLARTTGHRVGECTSMAYHDQYGAAFVAQNWDMSSWLHELDTIIILESHCDSSGREQGLIHIALTEAGQLARSGMNSHGMGLCANSLWCSEDCEPYRPVLPFTLARRMFLECTNLAEGVKTMCAFPRHVSGNIVTASPELAINLELTPSRYLMIEPQLINGNDPASGLLVTHANHFVSSAITSGQTIQDTYPGGSSLFRDTRLRRLLSLATVQEDYKGFLNRHAVRYGAQVNPPTPLPETFPQPESLPIETIKHAFSDHASFPRSICEHLEKSSTASSRLGAASTMGGSPTMTVACVIYELKRLEMHVCKGNPCQANLSRDKNGYLGNDEGRAEWQTYRISHV